MVFFHIFTRILFPIGMFPYIMIASAFIFFDAGYHRTFIGYINRFIKQDKDQLETNHTLRVNRKSRSAIGFVTFLLVLQVLLPWRYLLYPGELFWHEQGFRFSWRVMLMEKAGYAAFTVVDKSTGRTIEVQNDTFLTAFQEKQMSFQPDFILEYAHWLADHYKQDWHSNDVAVYAQVHVALNGRASRPFVDNTVNLAAEKRGWHNKHWILPFDDTISGL